ncbi:hypothetical protein S140_53 [Shewanella sp. phage 1/40]|uniref:hypothetical protein n=1 Tax=Shewanella sp. phage 1/40 TaxID=1458860 RepID=UPI0004F8AD90|nr:hypothetical protein S140_53 [Shewanella sp. phage 1/40]AHK11463.1 hypothetical protein S140_53 [Shewanella sp. phage 1/40]
MVIYIGGNVPPRLEKYDWFTVGLDKPTTFKLRDYVRKKPEYTEAFGSAAIVTLITEALNSDAIQRNIEFVKLLDEMEGLSARDKVGLANWQQKKNELLGVV